MSAPLSFDPERFCRRFLSHGFSGLLGLEYLSHGSDSVELLLPRESSGGDMDVAEEDMTTFGLLDMAGTVAVWVALGEFRPHATVDMRVDHLGGDDGAGDLIGEAACVKINGDLAFVTGHARGASGERVALFNATYMFTGR